MSNYDVIIIGAGPSGLMAANIFEKRGLEYLIFDKNKAAGRKLLITGGTRCNVTNIFNPKEFIDHLKIKHKRFLFSSLNSFGTKEIKEFFEDKGVQLNLEKEYQYFPKSSKSSDILDALLEDIDYKKLILNTTVKDITYEDNHYIVETISKDYKAKNVIISTGSKSYPKTGSTGDGLLFGKNLGHNFAPFYPAETHVYSDFVKKNKNDLQGLSLLHSEIQIEGNKKIYSGGLLFTHFGLSGPLIQNISELIYLDKLSKDTNLLIKLTDKNESQITELFHLKENQKARVIRILEKLTIKRLAKFILNHLQIDETKLVASTSKKQLQLIIDSLLHFTIPITKVESISNAFVNGGGILTNEINPSTMESKIKEGLYFTGEVLDLHGPIGGFNITIALSTGYTAASNIRRD